MIDARRAEFEFELPQQLEAHEPPEARGVERDGVRLLVTSRTSGSVAHAKFRDLPAFVRSGDVIVVNVSATIPASLEARTEDGRELKLNLSTKLPGNLWTVEPRGVDLADRTPPARLALAARASATLLIPYLGSKRFWVAALDANGSMDDFLRAHGAPIGYSYLTRPWPIETYQTVYAREPGSAEMPSAGRPFSLEVIERIRRKGATLAELTLHTGVSSPERDERPYEEWYSIPAETAARVNAARRFGGRVIAVGTTVVRALESAADASGRIVASNGWTGLVITPSRGVRVATALLTGFHEPRSTHLDMLEAFAGRSHVETAYRAALENAYLWHEFGDSHLIL